MDNDVRKIFEGLKRVLGNSNMIATGEVQTVDKEDFTCEVLQANGNIFKDVQLKALKSAAKGAVLVPKVNTTVWLLSIGSPDWLLIAAEELEAVYVDAETEIIFNGGKNGGIPITGKVVERLNNVEDDLNTLKNAFKTWLVTPQDGGAKLFAAATAWMNQPIIKTQDAQIENAKVKH